MNSVHAVSSCSCKINCNFILSCKALFLKQSRFFQLSSPTCFTHFSCPSYVPYNPCISYFLISSIQYCLSRTKNYNILSIFSFCLPPVTSFHFGRCVFLSNLFSNTFSLCSSRSLRFQVSHTLKNEKLRQCIF